MIKTSIALAASYLGARSLISRVKLPEESLWSFEDFCVKNEFNIESHWVTTKDGYILRLFRVSKSFDNSKPPVLLVHGMSQTSFSYVMGKPVSPAFFLANNGQDVWLLNTRGNYFSRLHQSLSARQPQYWDWTAHEIALNDIPASIDFILSKTKYAKLNYIGHSQGAHVLLSSLAYLPQYNQKVNVAGLLGPVGGTVTGQARYFKKLTSDFNINYLKMKGINFVNDYAHTGSNLAKFAQVFPDLAKKIGKDRFDVSINNDDPQYLKLYLQKFSGGTSLKNLEYYNQLKKNKSPMPVAFDYGRPEKNMQKYGTTSPPRADYSKINTKLAIFYGKYDQICTPKDGETLIMSLPKTCILHHNLSCNQDHSGFIISSNQAEISKIFTLITENPISA